MKQLKEKEIVFKFNIAGYDLEDIDSVDLHNSVMLYVTQELNMFAVVGNFQSQVNEKKVKS
jgi:hypothetical protein